MSLAYPRFLGGRSIWTFTLVLALAIVAGAKLALFLKGNFDGGAFYVSIAAAELLMATALLISRLTARASLLCGVVFLGAAIVTGWSVFNGGGGAQCRCLGAPLIERSDALLLQGAFILLSGLSFLSSQIRADAPSPS